jgi:hypothetical protein
MSNLIESLEDAKLCILNRMPDSAIDAIDDALAFVRATEPVGRIYLITDIPEVEWYTDVWEGTLLYTAPKTVDEKPGVTFVTEEAQAERAEDMSDWRNWLEGDLVECVNDDHVAELCRGDVLSLLGVYKVSELIRVKLSSPLYHTYNPARFRWHSRPARDQP